MEHHDQSRHQSGRRGRGQQPSSSDASGVIPPMYYDVAGNPIHLQTTYGQGMQTSDAQRHYTYPSDLIFNMPEQTQLSQFGMPGTAQNYHPGPPSLPISQLGMPAQYSTAESLPQASASMAPRYAMDPPQSASYTAYTQYQAQQPPPPTELEAYQTEVRHIFTLAHEGSLGNLGPRLLQVSRYLLGNVEELGLTRDEEGLHDGRIRLWDEFNRAWLVPLQRQLDLTQQMERNNPPLAEHQSIMDTATLERLSSELVRLCDSIEQYGLVDYQMGVAEEAIMDLLLRCLSALGSSDDEQPHAGSSAAGAQKRRGG